MIQSDLERLKKRLSQWVNKPKDINHRAMGALAYLTNAGKAPSLDLWVSIIREIARPSHARATALAYARDISDQRGAIIAVEHDIVTFTPAIGDYACSLNWQLTDDEKEKIFELADADSNIRKNWWNDGELLDAVRTYVEMQNKESSGHQFIKSHYYKLLAEKHGRTEKSFEYRMQNISYVLQNMGKKWLTGLKPAKNVGANIAEKIEEYLLHEYGEKSHKVAAFEIEWRNELEKFKRDNSQIPSGNTKPGVIVSETSQYCRDPKIKAWILKNANGKCECCCKYAPFTAFDGLPYLEVHHIIRLADGGPDTISNAIAVCPNCHRELHFGAESHILIARLYNELPRLNRKS